MAYIGIAAQEGKSIVHYLDEIDEKGMKRFADEFVLEFNWEDKSWEK